MTRGVVIRPATAEDVSAVLDLLRQLGYAFDASSTFERLLVDPAHTLLVAEEHGRVIGYANLNVRPHLHHERPVGTLDEL